jgi:hypothetical protein
VIGPGNGVSCFPKSPPDHLSILRGFYDLHAGIASACCSPSEALESMALSAALSNTSRLKLRLQSGHMFPLSGDKRSPAANLAYKRL